MKKAIIYFLLPLMFGCTQPDYNIQKDERPKYDISENRTGGLLPDDPVRVDALPMIASADYINSHSLLFNQKGKPVKPDNIAPTVKITYPTAGSTVSGTVNVQIIASDNVAVVAVGFYINGVSSTTTWNTLNYANGVYQLKAIAYDARGNIGSFTISVTVSNNIVTPPVDTTKPPIDTTPKPPSGSSHFILMPTPGQQGGEGSCVAWTVGYGVRSAKHLIDNHETTYSFSTNVFSPEYLYNQTRFVNPQYPNDCGGGTSMQLALDFIVANGICTYQSMPYSGTNGCSLLPNADQSAEAFNYKIPGYSKILSSDVAAIKSMIDSDRPVILAILADQQFMDAGPGFIWKTDDIGSLPHCVAICGYDDSKNAFKVMNSWGVDWCDGGFGWIDYSLFGVVTGTYCYVIN